MRENAKDIAQRVRGLREDMGISASDMAEHVQVTAEQYAAYESGAEDIPASILTEIAGRLKIDFGTLLTGTTPKMSLFSVTRKGRGASVPRRKDYMYESLAASFRDAKFEPFVVTLPVTDDAAAIPQNTHPGQEFNYILEGSMLVKVQDNEVTLNEGDSVIYDATAPHGMKAIGGPAKFLAIITV